jgi:pimeloyl-ACP methyl ester carboxylesterase
MVLHRSYMNIPGMGEIVGRPAETHRVYALELQGHGRTTDIERPITYPNLAGDVAAFMEAVGIEKADVFGYSMGAATGLRLAIDHPEKVDQLVFASGAYDFQGWQPAFSSRSRREVPSYLRHAYPREKSVRGHAGPVQIHKIVVDHFPAGRQRLAATA